MELPQPHRPSFAGSGLISPQQCRVRAARSPNYQQHFDEIFASLHQTLTVQAPAFWSLTNINTQAMELKRSQDPEEVCRHKGMLHVPQHGMCPCLHGLAFSGCDFTNAAGPTELAGEGHVSRPTGASLSLFPGIPACERYQAVVGTAGLLTPVHNQQPFTINDTNRYVSALNIYSLDTLNSFYRRFNNTTGGFFINVGLKLSFSCAMKAQINAGPVLQYGSYLAIHTNITTTHKSLQQKERLTHLPEEVWMFQARKGYCNEPSEYQGVLCSGGLPPDVCLKLCFQGSASEIFLNLELMEIILVLLPPVLRTPQFHRSCSDLHAQRIWRITDLYEKCLGCHAGECFPPVVSQGERLSVCPSLCPLQDRAGTPGTEHLASVIAAHSRHLKNRHRSDLGVSALPVLCLTDVDKIGLKEKSTTGISFVEKETEGSSPSAQTGCTSYISSSTWEDFHCCISPAGLKICAPKENSQICLSGFVLDYFHADRVGLSLSENFRNAEHSTATSLGTASSQQHPANDCCSPGNGSAVISKPLPSSETSFAGDIKGKAMRSGKANLMNSPCPEKPAPRWWRQQLLTWAESGGIACISRAERDGPGSPPSYDPTGIRTRTDPPLYPCTTLHCSRVRLAGFHLCFHRHQQLNATPHSLTENKVSSTGAGITSFNSTTLHPAEELS
ncbi:hypothetical protein Anapl_08510 [Anas platyrhynchos]|uniref:Uncharacterized protein n=1 Tax=Anas platyrhynchos TaxID=8839 RepID=R0KC60_ANAPL|nr:hypothetical protein Anapl_08510 [Anas platyrhynchos]